MKKTITTEVYEAEFSQYRNDLFWEFRTPSEFVNGEYVFGETLKWSGYNDENWWENVCTRKGWGERQDSRGRTWKLDPETDMVVQIN